MTSARNEMILASAGTGKTYTLSSRYLGLLVDGVDPQSILATTFTRKAAGEILDRVIQRLADASLAEEHALETAHEIGRDETTRQEFAELLTDLTGNLNNLQIETLDAFFGRIARSFSLDLGLPPDWEIVEDDEMTAWQNRAIRRTLNQRNAVNIVFDLAQGEAKRGISRMISTLVDDLYGIYRETFDTNTLGAWEALQEMPVLTESEIDRLTGQLLQIEPVGPNSYCNAYQNDVSNVIEQNWMNLLDKNLSKALSAGQFTYNRREIQPEIVQALSPLVQHAIAIQINLMVRQTRAASRFLKVFHREFDRLKMEHATLRFDDVNYLAHRLLDHHSVGQLAWRMDRRIDHLLLDEFQDTSVEQWKVLQPIARRACSLDPNRSFFCVGDVKQAIYGWRGGVAEIFDDVRTEFADALEPPGSLNKSWRSSPVIIETVNRIFQAIPDNPKLKDERPAWVAWCDRFESHETQKLELDGYAVLQNSGSETGHEAEVARTISQWVSRYPGKSVGVLVRTNDQIAKLFFELGLAGVPASEEGGNPLTDSAAVNLILSGLRLMDHPDDQIARFHILHSPLAERFGLSRENGNPDACRNAVQSHRQSLLQRGYGDLIAEWAKSLDPFCTARESFRVGQLIEKGYRVSVADHPRTREFVSWVETTRVPDPTSAAVRVMTIHKSKGLEFDIVVLPHLEFKKSQSPSYIVGRDSPTSPVKLVCRYMNTVKQEWLPEQFQSAFAEHSEARIHELLSMMYVALTRARQALLMVVPPNTRATHRSAAGLIMNALGVGESLALESGSQILWESGNPEWQRHPPPEAATPPGDSGKGDDRSDAPHDEDLFIRFAPSKLARQLPWESPSSREGGDRVRLGRLLQLEDNRDARITGSLIHAGLELIHWLEEGEIDESRLREHMARVEGADKLAVQSAIQEFRKIIRRPGIRDLLSLEHYRGDLFDSWENPVVQNERRFAVRMDNRILNGCIDRLVLLNRNGITEAADVIDFKTDRLAPGDHEAIRKRTEIYRPQLTAYRDAVAQILKLPSDRISARLVYVAIDHQVQID